MKDSDLISAIVQSITRDGNPDDQNSWKGLIATPRANYLPCFAHRTYFVKDSNSGNNVLRIQGDAPSVIFQVNIPRPTPALHHIIPKDTLRHICRSLYWLFNECNNPQAKYQKLLSELCSYTKQWNLEADRVEDFCFMQSIVWNPGNLIVGPEGELRIDENGANIETKALKCMESSTGDAALSQLLYKAQGLAQPQSTVDNLIAFFKNWQRIARYGVHAGVFAWGAQDSTELLNGWQRQLQNVSEKFLKLQTVVINKNNTVCTRDLKSKFDNINAKEIARQAIQQRSGAVLRVTSNGPTNRLRLARRQSVDALGIN
jgi:hypothetical protein